MFTSEGSCKREKKKKKSSIEPEDLHITKRVRILATAPFLEMPITKRRITK